MTLQESADKFAGAYADTVKKLFIETFREGYGAGYLAGAAAVRNESQNDNEDEGDFIDLGLPSETLWREDFMFDEDLDIMRLAYNEARNYSLPTEQQCRELMSKCIAVREKNGITFRGKDREELYLEFTDQTNNKSGKTDAYVRFWVKSDADEDLNALCLQFSILNPIEAGFHFCRRFVGEKLAVLTVKNKKKSK